MQQKFLEIQSSANTSASPGIKWWHFLVFLLNPVHQTWYLLGTGVNIWYQLWRGQLDETVVRQRAGGLWPFDTQKCAIVYNQLKCIHCILLISLKLHTCSCVYSDIFGGQIIFSTFPLSSPWFTPMIRDIPISDTVFESSWQCHCKTQCSYHFLLSSSPAS